MSWFTAQFVYWSFTTKTLGWNLLSGSRVKSLNSEYLKSLLSWEIEMHFSPWKQRERKNPFLPNGVCAPFVENVWKQPAGLWLPFEVQTWCPWYKLQSFYCVIFMKENDTYYALNYSNDPLIQRLNLWQPLPLGTQPKLRRKKNQPWRLTQWLQRHTLHS